MTQEEKQLLLVDLSARLPYGVVCDIYNETCTITEKLLIGGLSHFCNDTIAVRPYLRPMSSMTEEEVKELYKLLFGVERIGFPDLYKEEQNAISSLYDWLNAHHFDYRGLIEKGLAIEVTEENNLYESKQNPTIHL